jgi:hypothetical protein
VLAQGVVSDEGVQEIRTYLHKRSRALFRDSGALVWTPEYKETLQSLAEVFSLAGQLAHSLDQRAVTREGTFVKRLGKALYKHDGSKLPADALSQVGNYVGAHSRGSDVSVELTRDFNLGAEAFYHEDSCWYSNGDYAKSLCALKSNHGIGLRSFSNQWNVSGRAWILPVSIDSASRAVPSTTPNAYIVFNGYGDLDGYSGARVVSQLTGMTYKRISFNVDAMYINNDSGYLVAPEDIAAPISNLRLNVDVHAYAYN